MSLISDAIARQDTLHVPSINYDRMKDVLPRQRSALRRAVKSGDPEKIAAVCKAAVSEWNEIGAWPDDWSNWQRALNDALPFNRYVGIEFL